MADKRKRKGRSRVEEFEIEEVPASEDPAEE